MNKLTLMSDVQGEAKVVHNRNKGNESIITHENLVIELCAV